jgi:hypothetical protein
MICRLLLCSTEAQQLLFSSGYKQQRKNGKGEWRADCECNLQEFWSLPQPFADQPVEALAGAAAAAGQAKCAVHVAYEVPERRNV